MFALKSSHASVFWFFVLVADVVEDVFFARHWQGGAEVVEGSDGILVEGETLLQSFGPHRLVEHVAAGEVEDSTKILIFGEKPRNK